MKVTDNLIDYLHLCQMKQDTKKLNNIKHKKHFYYTIKKSNLK